MQKTRLGKFVNEMRKKTSNKDLSKRAKNLVRRWQDMVLPQATQGHGQFNGDKIAQRSVIPAHIKTNAALGSSKPASPASRPGTPLSAASSTSPGLPSNRLSPKAGLIPATAAGYVNNNTNNSSVKQPHGVAIYDTPKKTHNGHNNNALLSARPVTPTGGYHSKTDLGNSKKRRIVDNVDSEIPAKKSLLDQDTVDVGCNRNSVINGVVTSTPKQGEYHAASRQALLGTSINKGASSDHLKTYSRTQAKVNSSFERTNSTSSLQSDKSEPVGNVSRTPVMMKTPRVKTTAQLLEELASSGNINVRNSATVKKIALNQIDKEIDYDTPVVPASAKPRARRKPKHISPPQISDKSLHETKNEMVHKFLETAIPPQTPDFDLGNNSNLVQNLSIPSMEEESPTSVSVCERPRESSSFSRGELSGHSSHHSSGKDETACNKLLQMVRSENSTSLSVKFTLGDNESRDHEKNVIKTTSNSISDLWALLPPLDDSPIDWKSLDYTPAERAEVNDETVERLHSEQWSGVNGHYDHRQQWNNWEQTYSMPSYDGDLLHILPYVVLDDFDEEVLPEVS